jgi:hypothetical protein
VTVDDERGEVSINLAMPRYGIGMIGSFVTPDCLTRDARVEDAG